MSNAAILQAMDRIVKLSAYHPSGKRTFPDKNIAYGTLTSLFQYWKREANKNVEFGEKILVIGFEGSLVVGQNFSVTFKRRNTNSDPYGDPFVWKFKTLEDYYNYFHPDGYFDTLWDESTLVEILRAQ